MTQIEIWRSQAAATLAFLVPKIVGSSPTTNDGLVDDLVRLLNNLPDRPETRQPYAGIFPSADLATWRSRAALTLKAVVPRIQNVEGSVYDGAIDDLIRFMRNLPSRPTGRLPYSGLFPSADLATWRKQASQVLVAAIAKITDPKYTVADGKIDDLIRAMSGLPLRPILRNPYEGLYPAPNLMAARSLVARRVQQLIDTLKDDFNPKDILVDSTIRALNNLPPRAVDQEPYSGLYPPTIITPDLITSDQLSAIAVYTSQYRLNQLLPNINITMQRYGITTALRKAHFLAQTAHESDGFNTNEEYASGADYEGRRDLGNSKSGDGVRFKGRGLIQVTGRSNYAECGQALGVDLINNPQRLAEFDLACLSAGWYWDSRNLNSYADADDLIRITRIINGGLNGLDDRQSYLDRAKQVFGI